MTSKKPIKHHYIPKYHINGFGNSGQLYEYDKNRKKINPNFKNSSQLFYKKDLYTVSYFGETTWLIEEGYSTIEGRLSKFIRTIENLNSEELYELSLDKNFANLIKINISIQFWRNPLYEQLAQSASKVLLKRFDEFYKCNEDYIFFSRKDVKYLFNRNHKKPIFKFIQFFILPFITFKFDGTLPEGFKILKVNEFGYERDLVCTDNPVCFEQINDEMEFSGYFHFPLTRKLLITNDTEHDFDKIQHVMIGKAKEKVVGSSIELLNHFFP